MKSLKIAKIISLSVLCVHLAQVASAALTISSDNIVDGKYTYSLKNDTNFVTTFNADVFTKDAVQAERDGSNNGYVRAFGGRIAASFVYSFDFSSTGSTALGVTFTDGLRNFDSKATSTTAYSIDGGTTWHTIRTLAASGTSGPSATTISFSALLEYSESITSVLYRTTFVANNSGVSFTSPNNQWGRVANAGTIFTATFELTPAIPEPSTWAVLLGSGVFIATIGIRRNRGR